MRMEFSSGRFVLAETLLTRTEEITLIKLRQSMRDDELHISQCCANL